MSGTYQIDGQLFITQPLDKQWHRQVLGRKGSGEPVYSPYWSLSLSFPILDFGSGSAGNWLIQHWLDNELHSAVLPHPVSGFLTTFSGVAIDDVSVSILDYDSDSWIGGVQVNLSHIALSNSWSIPNQPEWWFPKAQLVDLELNITGSYNPVL